MPKDKEQREAQTNYSQLVSKTSTITNCEYFFTFKPLLLMLRCAEYMLSHRPCLL